MLSDIEFVIKHLILIDKFINGENVPDWFVEELNKYPLVMKVLEDRIKNDELGKLIRDSIL